MFFVALIVLLVASFSKALVLRTHSTCQSWNRYLRICMSTAETSQQKKFKLSEKLLVSDFISKYGLTDNLQGVYVIIDGSGVSQFVGSTTNVAGEIIKLREAHGENTVASIRFQSFSKFNADIISAYTEEVIAKMMPVNKINTVAGDATKASGSNKIDELRGLMENTGMISPFSDIARNNDGEAAASEKKELSLENVKPVQELDFTVENVNKVLDEVRPYLISDGGNVAVVSVDPVDRSVKLSLQGACGSCPSSTTTMKMGIERVLKENFANLGAVVAVEVAASPSSPDPVLFEEDVVKALAVVLPAVTKMGGSVDVVSVDAATGTVTIRYSGPPRLKQGVELVLKDIKTVKNVVVV